MDSSSLKVVKSNLVSENTSWKDMEKQGSAITDTGNSNNYKTGNWVPEKLLFHKDNCINCTLCWPVCPDDAIVLDTEGNMIGIDLEHCKDCGLCVKACPANKNPDSAKHALTFVSDYRDDF